MKWLTLDARLACDHGGRIANKNSQDLVRINGVPVLVSHDPVGRSIGGCPNLNPTAGIKPCTNTLAVIEGYSAFVTIDDKMVCLDTIRGLTDGTPPGTVNYTVKAPGQNLVDAGA
jgi:hypothetical protein